MISDFINVIGQGYTPIVTTLPDGSYDVSMDWAYIGCMALLIVVLYCVLRIVGRLLCGRERG